MPPHMFLCFFWNNFSSSKYNEKQREVKAAIEAEVSNYYPGFFIGFLRRVRDGTAARRVQDGH